MNALPGSAGTCDERDHDGAKSSKISVPAHRSAVARGLGRGHAQLLLFAGLAASLSPALATAGPDPSHVEGRWNIMLEMPGGDFETPVEFVAATDGTIGATVLGPMGQSRITDAVGELKRDRLKVRARTSFGSIKVTAKLAGDMMRGTWQPAGIASLFFKGALIGKRESHRVVRAPLAVFDDAWIPLTRYFYAPDYNGIDIADLRERYRDRASAARSEGELVTLMRAMMQEFNTSHLDFFATPKWTPELHPGSPAAVADTTEGISWRSLAADVGYLKVESFSDNDAVIERIDRAFVELGGKRALVIDLRGNGGGSLTAAMRLGDHILPDLRPVGYFASRDGLERRGLRSIDQLARDELARFTGYGPQEFGTAMAREGAIMVMTGGRAPQTYRGRVVLLIDQYSYSASEALAGVVKEADAATLIGRPTPGLMLGAQPISVEGGWTLVLPVFDFRTPRGQKIEGVGVAPDIAVKERGRDADIPAALRFLRKS